MGASDIQLSLPRAVRETGVWHHPARRRREAQRAPAARHRFPQRPQTRVSGGRREPAVVFPPFYFGQIYEARCFPGTITVKPTLLLELFQGVLDEIGRNGFRKIILLNAHGGNTAWLAFLAQCALWEEKSYSVYRYTGTLSEERRHAWDELVETKLHAHACECETSISLAGHSRTGADGESALRSRRSTRTPERPSGESQRDQLVQRLPRSVSPAMRAPPSQRRARRCGRFRSTHSPSTSRPSRLMTLSQR